MAAMLASIVVFICVVVICKGEIDDLGDKALGCPSGAYLFKGKCYEIVRKPETYYDAQQICKDRGGSLANITERDSLLFVEKLRIGLFYFRYWVGFQADNVDFRTSGQISWSKWAPENPLPLLSCVAMSPFYNLRWESRACDSRLLPICIFPNTTKCASSNEKFYQGSCYQFENEMYSYDAAQSNCKPYGGHLVTPRDEEEHEFLQTQVRMNRLWTKLTEDQVVTYYSNDRIPTLWMETNRNAAVLSKEQDLFATIAKIQKDTRCSGYARDGIAQLMCMGRYYFTCIYDIGTKPTVPAPTEAPTVAPTDVKETLCTKAEAKQATKCSYNTYLLDNTCYGLVYYLDTWEQGIKNCEITNGEMVTVDSQGLLSFLRKLRNWELDTHYWIGLRKDDDTWKYEDDTPVGEGFWGKGEPNGHGIDGPARCAVISAYHYLNWDDQSCHVKYQAICEYTGSQCKLGVDNRCYHISEQRMSYVDAMKYCSRKQWDLAMPKTSQQHQYLRSTILKIRSRTDINSISDSSTNGMVLWVKINQPENKDVQEKSGLWGPGTDFSTIPVDGKNVFVGSGGLGHMSNLIAVPVCKYTGEVTSFDERSDVKVQGTKEDCVLTV